MTHNPPTPSRAITRADEARVAKEQGLETVYAVGKFSLQNPRWRTLHGERCLCYLPPSIEEA